MSNSGNLICAVHDYDKCSYRSHDPSRSMESVFIDWLVGFAWICFNYVLHFVVLREDKWAKKTTFKVLLVCLGV